MEAEEEGEKLGNEEEEEEKEEEVPALVEVSKVVSVSEKKRTSDQR